MGDFLNLGLIDAFVEATATDRFIRGLRKKGQVLQKAFIRLEWPPPWHLPARSVDELANAANQGKLSTQEFEELVVELYDADLLKEIQKGWENQGFLEDRLPILREAVECYVEGKYYAAVCTILPQIEGIIGDYLGRKPNARNDAGRIFRGSGLSKAAMDFYVRFVNENFDWTAGAPDASRHSILHGHDKRFGTAPTALKFLLTFDVVQSGIGDRKRDEESQS